MQKGRCAPCYLLLGIGQLQPGRWTAVGSTLHHRSLVRALAGGGRAGGRKARGPRCLSPVSDGAAWSQETYSSLALDPYVDWTSRLGTLRGRGRRRPCGRGGAEAQRCEAHCCRLFVRRLPPVPSPAAVQRTAASSRVRRRWDAPNVSSGQLDKRPHRGGRGKEMGWSANHFACRRSCRR
eukprot:COSAG02_NODE_1877_length_10559_cov_8.819025_5_plen_180_part_00